jgi:hypothetical protein
MNQTEIKDYRKILEKEFSEKDLEIETSLSYISIGSLGFFITINEKFTELKTAHYKAILIISLIFLLLSFILILYRKSRTSHFDFKMMRFLDGMKPDSQMDDQGLYEIWKQSHSVLSRIRIYIYFSLAFGLALQLLFLLLNLNI